MLLTPLCVSLLSAIPLWNGEPDEPVSKSGESQTSTWVVDYLHVGNGEVLENAVVTITDGKIVAVVPGGDAPDDASQLEGAHLTPGLIDAFSYMGVGDHTVEASRETTAGLKLADTLRLDDPSFGRAASEGVTSAFITPDSLNAFGGLAAMVKTAGGQPADLFADEGESAQLVLDAAALKISLGNDVAVGNRTPGFIPNSFFIRRPTTRMGTVWAIRSTFYKAVSYAKEREAGEAEFNADLEIILKAMRGEIPIRVHARRNNDIQTALRLAQEFGWQQYVIEEGTEAYRASGLLAAAGVPVVAGPAYDSRQRAFAQGPSLAELRYLASPPQICCEHLHEDAFQVEVGGFAEFPEHHICGADDIAADYVEVERDIWGLPVDRDDAHDHEEHHEALPENDLARDLMLRLGGEDFARGLNSGRFSEGDQSTPALAALLQEAGVMVALGGAESHDAPATEASLIHQARRAVQYGLARDSAISMVTSRAAALCGMADRLGMVKVGFDADLVLWSGDPLDTSSRPLVVLIDGEVVVDNRN